MVARFDQFHDNELIEIAITCYTRVVSENTVVQMGLVVLNGADQSNRFLTCSIDDL